MPEMRRNADAGDYLAALRGRHGAVVGIGVSNVPLIRFLCRAGARVTAFDRRGEADLASELAALAGYDVDYRLGPGYLDTLSQFGLVYLSPGVSPDQPEIVAAQGAGAEFSSEIDVVLHLARCPVAAITGSSGKTTTTTLVGRVLTHHAAVHMPRRRVLVGGNIGEALVEKVLDVTPDDIIVLELSSFQLKPLRVSPDISAVLNITPNHLDVHPSMEDYIWSKGNILRHQGPEGWAVLGADSAPAAGFAAEAPGRVAMFSVEGERPVECGAFLEGNSLMLRWDGGRPQAVLDRDQLLIPGMHNVQNALAAMAVSRVAGADAESMAQSISSFKGVEHRLEPVAELGGVQYINDSIATTPARTIAALRAVERPIVLIAGGYDKHLPFDEMAEEAIGKVRAVVLIGVTAPQIENALLDAAARRSAPGATTGTATNTTVTAAEPPDIAIVHADTFERAVEEAARLARPGDTVLLSPACASYGMFRNFMERGRTFKELVSVMAARARE
ncbi:MAG: UDP-N-acetylmuramoylalanine--D-glutamate ligase [Firmicutes bacterium ADurb.Bin506]|nr:MAG: UDP-N-acetylmuramoylalanine--D-glutamate ligase [Firmicutes bacterium ADurb.Bin506]